MRKHFKHDDEHDPVDRWLISYADFLTLIFTFFAALYSLSTLDKVKAGQFSTSLNMAFKVMDMPVTSPIDDRKKFQSEIAGAISDVKGISVRSDPRGVFITLENDIAFITGSADMNDQMGKVLGDLAVVLANNPGRIVIEGHTDDRPLVSNRYKTNWELSTARAASVLHTFIREGLDPNRFIIAGYGEYRPAVTNLTAEGRGRNRRVEIVFSPATVK